MDLTDVILGVTSKTYDQGANKILHLVAAKVKVFVHARELREVEGHLLFAEGAAGEVCLGELAWCFGRDARFFVDAFGS